MDALDFRVIMQDMQALVKKEILNILPLFYLRD